MTKGSFLFREGDNADHLYYVMTGKVKIIKTVDEGGIVILHVLDSGDMYGELTEVGRLSHGFGAEVAQDGIVGIIRQKDLFALLQNHHDLAVRFLSWAGIINRITQFKLRDLFLYGKLGALCSILIRLSRTVGQSTPEGIRIAQKFTNTDLAHLIGSTREGVNRTLNKLKRAKVIGMEHGYITILDIEFLKDICQCRNCPSDVCRL
jgi:CRP/FNR family transcriptional regulator